MPGLPGCSLGRKITIIAAALLRGDKLSFLNEEQITTSALVPSITELHCDGIVCGFMINLNGGDKISASEINEL